MEFSVAKEAKDFSALRVESPKKLAPADFRAALSDVSPAAGKAVGSVDCLDSRDSGSVGSTMYAFLESMKTTRQIQLDNKAKVAPKSAGSQPWR